MVEVAVNRAEPADAEQIRDLFSRVYGRDYALPTGTDLDVIRRTTADPDTWWMVARERRTGVVVGSTLLRTCSHTRVGKAEGLAVAPEHRRSGLADRLFAATYAEPMSRGGLIDSLYLTARSASVGPQRVALNHQMVPTGIVPRIVRGTAGWETWVSFNGYADGVLERGVPLGQQPAQVVNLIEATVAASGRDFGPVTAGPPVPVRASNGSEVRFEVFSDAAEVRRRYRERWPDPGRYAYPFVLPNVLFAAQGGAVEIYTRINGPAGYCFVLDTFPRAAELGNAVRSLVRLLALMGVEYIETSGPLRDGESVAAFLAAGFLATSWYPAMQRDGGRFRHGVMLVRPAALPDLNAAQFAPQLEPFLTHLIRAWHETERFL